MLQSEKSNMFSKGFTKLVSKQILSTSETKVRQKNDRIHNTEIRDILNIFRELGGWPVLF